MQNVGTTRVQDFWPARLRVSGALQDRKYMISTVVSKTRTTSTMKFEKSCCSRWRELSLRHQSEGPHPTYKFAKKNSSGTW